MTELAGRASPSESRPGRGSPPRRSPSSGGEPAEAVSPPTAQPRSTRVSAATQPARPRKRGRAGPAAPEPALRAGSVDPAVDPVEAARAICLRLLTVRQRTRAELAAELARR